WRGGWRSWACPGWGGPVLWGGVSPGESDGLRAIGPRRPPPVKRVGSLLHPCPGAVTRDRKAAALAFAHDSTTRLDPAVREFAQRFPLGRVQHPCGRRGIALLTP